MGTDKSILEKLTDTVKDIATLATDAASAVIGTGLDGTVVENATETAWRVWPAVVSLARSCQDPTMLVAIGREQREALRERLALLQRLIAADDAGLPQLHRGIPLPPLVLPRVLLLLRPDQAVID